MLLSYAGRTTMLFPRQGSPRKTSGLHETNVRKHLKSPSNNGLLAIKRRGQGKTKRLTN